MAERSIGATLEDDHHRIDGHLAAFAASLDAGEPNLDRWAAGAEGLRHHIWVEEERHFPPLREAGLVGPVLVMLREHGQLWDALDAIEAGIASDDDVRERWRGLVGLLEAHNMKEERILSAHGSDYVR